MPSKLSVSAAEAFQLCQRLYYYRYVVRREPKAKAPELMFGSAWHSRREGKTDNHGLQGIDLVKLEVLNAAYEKHWALEPLDILVHEEEFELPSFDGTRLDPDLLIVGRTDGRCKSSLVEFKTTSSYIDVGSYYWERVLDDLQIAVYMGAAWHQGHEFSEIIYDVARKPMIKRKPKETLDEFKARLVGSIEDDPGAYFVRRRIDLDSDRVAEAWRDLHTVGRQCQAGTDINEYPKTRRSCYAYNRPCSYLPVCRGQANIDNDDIYQVRSHR